MKLINRTQEGRLLVADSIQKKWLDLTSENKSYSVDMLHFFTFRPQRLKTCWVLEETLTWEFMHILDVIPRDIFLAEFLTVAGNVSPSVRRAIQPLVANPSIVNIRPYPHLGRWSKKYPRKKSDIGFEINSTPHLWIEAKVVQFKQLQREIEIQSEALRKRCPEAAVLALIPEDSDPPSLDYMTWRNVAQVIHTSVKKLQNSNVPQSFRKGYIKMLDEFQSRLSVHEKPLLHK